jgi:hypothetical protein
MNHMGKARATIQSSRPETMTATIATIGKTALCALPLVPAILINLEAAAGKGPAWTAFAIASVIFGAVCVENAVEGETVSKKLLWCIIAAVFLFQNVTNAIGNSAARSDDRRDVQSSQILKNQRLQERRNALSHRRNAQTAVAGEATADSIEAEIQSRKSADAKRWNASEGCKVEKISAGPTREFCAEIAQLEAKKAAALKRDEIDHELAGIETQDSGPVPSTADPYADNIARFIALFGYAVDDTGKAVIASSQDWTKGIAVELLAAFGPAGLLSLLSRPSRPKPRSELERAPVKPGKAKTPPTAAEPEATAPAPSQALETDAAIDAFIARWINVSQGSYVGAKALYETWKAYCEENGLEPGSQKSFSQRIQKRIGYDRNNGRPRYCHVEIKPARALPQLKIVAR